MPKFLELKNRELKLILAAHDLRTSGVKLEMVNRLQDALHTDTITNEDLVQLLLVPEEPDEDATDAVAQADDSHDDNEQEGSTGAETIDDQISTMSQAASPRTLQPINYTQRQNRFSVKEISETIPVYDPTNEQSMSAEHFVEHVDSAMRAYGFDAKCLLLAVYGQLKGVARLWLDGQRKLFTSWDEFKTELLTEFGQDLDEAEINSIMSNTMRRSDEKLIDYCFRIQAVGKRYNLSENAIIKYARTGLRNRDLQNAIAIVKFHSMRDMRKTLEDYESNIVGIPRPVTENRPNKREPNRSTYIKANANVSPKKELTCYNCNDLGHISRNCTKPQRKERCTICRRTNHKTENCFQRKNNVKQESINTLNDTSDTYQEVVRDIILEGQHFKAFLDSGSAVSLIRQRCVKCFENIAECSKTLNGFAGGQYEAKNKITTQLKIDDNLVTVELYVVRDEDIPENILIGRDIMCRKGSKFIIGHKTCEIRRIVSDSEHSTDEQNAIDELLNANKGCFAKNISELGKCTTDKMEIKLSTDVPINLRPYRVPFANRKIVDDIIKELLTHDIIRKSKSAYASPIVLVPKKNGEHRFCVDYRSINKITIKKPFPMPILEEQFAQLAGNVLFTTLDVRMGYYQVEMEENSKQYTAFVTTDGQFEFNRMPFGLMNAPAVFQKIMNEIIQELPRGEALAFLDDVIIPCRTIAEGIERLERFLKILEKHGLKLRPEKCHFFKTEIEYLGHVVSKDGIRPGQQNLVAVKNFKVPKNITEVRRFLGLTGFFRKFICDYAIIAKPITRLLHKDQIDNFQWTTDQQQAFENLIELLTTAPLLTLYDVNQYHEVHTDACMIGLAGILLQSSDGKTWKPVMYYSRHCTEAEQKYHSYELEVLAVVETFERFRLQLLTKHFTLVTDCAAIAHTKARTELKPRIARWWLRMQEYNFDIVHRPGNRLAHVDAMSRAPVQEACEVEQAGCIYRLEAEDGDWIVAMQQKDERAKLITNVLMKRVTSSEATLIRRDYVLKDYRLYRKIDDQRNLYVPKAARWGLVRHFHDEMGHVGIEKTMQRITKLFWFPKMRKVVKEYINNCTSCCFNKQQRRKSEGELHYEPPIPVPFRVLHLDHLGPFIKSQRCNTHLLVIIDAFSKFTIVKAVRNTKTVPVINALNEVVGYFGLPIKLITDRGTAFSSKLFAEYCKKHEIKHIQTAVRTPRANGQVERMNATLLDMIRTSTEQAKKWDEQLCQFQWVINSQQNATTRYSPNELVFSFNINNAIHNHLVAAMQDVEQTADNQTTQQKYDQVLENIATAREKWKARFDQKHATPTTYNEGDLVVIQYEAPATGESRKLEPKYRGPFVVKKNLGKDRYLITNVPGSSKARKFNSVYASDKMKPWCCGYPDVNDYTEETECETDGSNASDEDIPPDNDDSTPTNHDESEHNSVEAEADLENDNVPRQSRRLIARKGRTVTVQNGSIGEN